MTQRLTGRNTLTRLIALYCATIVALAGAIWFELPGWIASALLPAALALTVLVAICAGRTANQSLASIPFRKRPSITGRGVGMLVLVVLALVSVAIAFFVYPRSWPTRVEEAVAILSSQMDAKSKRELVYMGYDELATLQDTLGASLRRQFGLNTRNFRLAYDCDPEYIHPRSCSSIVISRLWKQLRAELPRAERESLETLEAGMDRVRLGSQQFQDAPLQEVVGFFNDAIRAQLPKEARFMVVYDPAQANLRVSTAWHIMGTISLREALDVLAEQGGWRIRKDPPNVVIERPS